MQSLQHDQQLLISGVLHSITTTQCELLLLCWKTVEYKAATKKQREPTFDYSDAGSYNGYLGYMVGKEGFDV